MTKSVSYSQHAFDTVPQRLSLTQDEVATILALGKYVTIGLKPAERKAFKIFWSPRDRDCFFAIQNYTTGKIISIQPLHYQHDFEVTEAQLIRLVMIDPEDCHEVLNSDNPPTRYHFTFQFLNTKTVTSRKCKYAIPISHYRDFAARFKALAYRKSVINQMIEFIGKKIQPNEILANVHINVGKHVSKIWVPWTVKSYRHRGPEQAQISEASVPDYSPPSDLPEGSS